MTPEEFVQWYSGHLTMLNVHEGEPQERIEQARTALGLDDKDIVLGMSQVCQAPIHVILCSHIL